MRSDLWVYKPRRSWIKNITYQIAISSKGSTFNLNLSMHGYINKCFHKLLLMHLTNVITAAIAMQITHLFCVSPRVSIVNEADWLHCLSYLMCSLQFGVDCSSAQSWVFTQWYELTSSKHFWQMPFCYCQSLKACGRHKLHGGLLFFYQSWRKKCLQIILISVYYWNKWIPHLNNRLCWWC